MVYHSTPASSKIVVVGPDRPSVKSQSENVNVVRVAASDTALSLRNAFFVGRAIHERHRKRSYGEKNNIHRQTLRYRQLGRVLLYLGEGGLGHKDFGD